jgi:outer membrane lipoprotein-sorting protein
MMTRLLKPILLLSAVEIVLLLLAFLGAAPSTASEDVLERSRTMYASLSSYADTGTVVKEYGLAKDPARDRHTFTTYFKRAPRGFYLDFKKEGGDRYVIWRDPEAFHTWWKTTHVQSDYPNPSNVGAFVGAGVTTVGATAKIPSLLYKKGALPSDFAFFTDGVVEGREDIGGHQCLRLVGTAKDVYGATGHETNIRKMTVWIDAESLLIRKVAEEWAPLPGQVSRTTTTFEQQANPTLEDSKLKFAPPSGEK